MNYPLISEYIEAIKFAEDNFDELSYLRPILGDDGLPVMTSGNFAVVFKMKDEQSGKLYAVKCFTKEQEGRAEAYREIAKELKEVSSPYLVSIRYLERELFVDTDQTTETEFPVLLMDWVEGKTLDKYLRENLDDKYALEMLAYRFSQLAQWLIPQPFAHGDLKPDNILVRDDGTLVLVDYDGMYVPAMKGQKARELGSPDFRHPLRTEDDFNRRIDDFPCISILLSLRAISIRPLYCMEFAQSHRLLFSELDYYDISHCEQLKLFSSLENYELNQLIWLFKEVYEKPLHSVLPFYINLNKPRLQYMNLSIEVKIADLETAWKDDKSVRYSADRTRLLKGPIIDYIKGHYRIQRETKVICNHAFSSCWGFERINLSNGLIRIGDYAFSGCIGLKYVDFPNSVVDIGNWAFHGCGLTSLVIPNNVKEIGEWAFFGCRDLRSLVLGNGLSIIEKGAFAECCRLEEVIIPQGVRILCKYAFSCCSNLKEIYLPKSLVEVCENTFHKCSNLQSIVVPHGYKHYFESMLPNLKMLVKTEETQTSNLYTDEFIEELYSDDYDGYDEWMADCMRH